MRNHQARFVTPFAVLGIAVTDEALVAIDFLPLDTPPLCPKTELANMICAQLEAYLRDPAFRFDLPLKLAGTPFQQRVWQELMAIPHNTPISYTELAQRAGSGARAVANACGANTIPVIIPCHRVVAKHGLGGFMQGRSSSSLSIKRWLLDHERS